MCIWRFGCCERHEVRVEDHGDHGLEAFSVGVLVLDWEGKDGWHGFA
jgi:hypothetical protein